MKFTPNISLKETLTRRYWKDMRKVLIQCRSQVMEQADVSDPETLRLMIPNLLDPTPMQKAILNIWSKVGGRYAYDTNRKIAVNKSGIAEYQIKADPEKLSDYERRMKLYASQRSTLKAKAIMDTETEAINRIISKVIDKSIAEGLSVPNTRKLMKEYLKDKLIKIENYQAERIARTEVNGASNTGSFEAVRESGAENVNKRWLASGLPNMRDSHIQFENEDNNTNGRAMDEEYAPGLQFPGDENGEAEEVINCRCTLIYETIEP